MTKKIVKKNPLLAFKRFVLVLTFKKHTIRLVLSSEKGVLVWKTSRSENFLGRARSTRVTAQFLGELMGKHMLSLGIKKCEVGIKGPDYRMSYTRAILFAVVKHGGVSITRVDILSKVRFGGTKFSKRANRKGKGKKKKKIKLKKKKNFKEMLNNSISISVINLPLTRNFSDGTVVERPMEISAINNGDKISLYSFLLAGGIVKDVIVKEFEVCFEVPRQSIIPFLVILKHHSLFNCDFLVDIVSWDKPGERFRFSVLYTFLSVSWNLRLNVLCQTREGVPLESVIDLYESASWLERECWDMHGVYFINHNNFLRLLTDYGFRGHPLRKDFPLSGFVELFYDDCSSGVLYEPVELVQEYRNFQFKSPWAEDAPVQSEEEDFDFNFESEEEERVLGTDTGNEC